MPDDSMNLTPLYLENLNLKYEIKTPGEEREGEVNCADENAPYTLFPFNFRYIINLFFISISVKLGKDKELYKILEFFWETIVKKEGLKQEYKALLVFSPEPEEQPREDIRFLQKKEILDSRFIIKRIHALLYQHAIDEILEMLAYPDDAVRILNQLKIEENENIGIVFLISSNLSNELLASYPFLFKGQDDTNIKLHANIISITVIENCRRNGDGTIERYLNSSLLHDKNDKSPSIDSELLIKKIKDINGISKNGNEEYINKEDVIQTISDHFSKINGPIRE